MSSPLALCLGNLLLVVLLEWWPLLLVVGSGVGLYKILTRMQSSVNHLKSMLHMTVTSRSIMSTSTPYSTRMPDSLPCASI
eukprot:10050582-Prorocentrum_lima.AAC.1